MANHGATTTFSAQLTGVSAPLHVTRFELVEGISELFELDLFIATTEKEIVFADVVGKPASLLIETEKREPRHVQGIVSRIRHGEDGQTHSAYRVTIVPKLWRLLHRQDSRIFQAQTVPDILKHVLSDAQVTDVRLALSGSYTARDYCVQYRETDFAFIHRLMEEEGIYYFFEHTDEKHTLVLADAPSASAPIASPDTVPFRIGDAGIADIECVTRFSTGEEVRPGKVSLTDYNFKKPSLSLMSSSSASVDTDLELYDYPGEYQLPGDGSNYAKVRLQEWQARRIVAEGRSGCIRMSAGFKFTLSDHRRESDNKEYLLTRVHHRGSQPHEDLGQHEESVYVNEFVATPADVQFRPERRTPRPTIKGIQTAIVTGPGGEEIHTDEHGRVKVHFHWDRVGKKDDKSSCWIRVSQLWAGSGWGAMWIPRIGHEVVVDFIEGDPDRPLIVGRVYHGANVPPYALPGEKTKSTIKSNSSQGGGGSNELRFEDKAGSEEIYLHGQKDWNIKIEHDKNQLVGHDETKKVGNDETYDEIGHDQKLKVDHDRKKEVTHDQEEKIGNDKTISVGGHHTETIQKTETLTVVGARSVNVGGAHAESIAGAQTVEVGAAQSISVGGGQSTSTGGNHSLSVGGGSSENISKAKSIETGEGFKLTVSKDMEVKVTKNIKEDAGEERTLLVAKKFSIKVGDASILLEKNGNITIEGKEISIKGSGPIKVQGSKINLKTDGAVNLEASGKVTIKGSQVGVN